MRTKKILVIINLLMASQMELDSDYLSVQIGS